MPQANAFARARAMIAAIAVAMQIGNLADRQIALSAVGPYRSRGKGSAKTSPSRHHVAMDKRVARKARNIKRHKATARG